MVGHLTIANVYVWIYPIQHKNLAFHINTNKTWSVYVCNPQWNEEQQNGEIVVQVVGIFLLDVKIEGF